MKVVFYSNFLNDHQLPLCLEFIKQLGEGNFFFVAHQEISQERLDLGFEDINEKYHFVIKSYKGGEEERYAQLLMLDADVVIVGSYRNMPFEQRIALNKLTFRYNERLLKKGDIYWFDPRLHLAIYKLWTRYKSNNLFTLCASAYTARDLSMFGYPKNKCFKWGYFPLVKEYENIEDFLKIKEYRALMSGGVNILWVGRFVSWKHPEYPIKIARKLKADGYKFTCNIIGTGPLQCELEKLINKFDLHDVVHLIGAMPPIKVREYMEMSQIFLFTSDRNEGWGVVLNEAMNSACAIIANNEIGSVPFLLKDGYNALTYDKTLDSAYKCVLRVINNGGLINILGKQAYYTITNDWNASVAVTNFLSVCHKYFVEGYMTPVISGVCSNA